MNLRILIELEVNDQGAVKSSHRPLSVEDSRLMLTLPSGGLVQVSHALTVEALRREAYTMAISQLSSGIRLEDMNGKELDQLVRTHVSGMLNQLSLKAAEEVIQMLRAQASPTEP